MTTKCRRFMVTVDEETDEYLHEIAEIKNMSISKTINALINQAMESNEDIYWSKEAEKAEIENAGKPTISSEDLWKKLGI